MNFSTAELRALHFYVRVADSVLPGDHPSRSHIPLLLERVDSEISVSRERNDTDTGSAQLEQHDNNKVGTAEAAQLLGCTQRRIQQRIKSGDLTAETIGRTYWINRQDIEIG